MADKMSADSPSEENQTILVIDDDFVLTQALAKAFRRRGYPVFCSTNTDSALEQCRAVQACYVVLDLKIGSENGLRLIPELRQINPDIVIIVLTGYGSIATAVEAVKLGATHYLTKPATVDQMIAALSDEPYQSEIPEQPQSLEDRIWDDIHQTLNETNYNISESARRLGMHRRTLQRKLKKNPD